MSVTSFNGRYMFLSNLMWVPVVIEGITFPSAENAYQAAKKFDEHWWKTCQLLSSVTVREMGETIDARDDWEQDKADFMQIIVEAKFDQHPELMAKLCEIEGEISDPQSDPLLGPILMKIRDANT